MLNGQQNFHRKFFIQKKKNIYYICSFYYFYMRVDIWNQTMTLLMVKYFFFFMTTKAAAMRSIYPQTHTSRARKRTVRLLYIFVLNSVLWWDGMHALPFYTQILQCMWNPFNRITRICIIIIHFYVPNFEFDFFFSLLVSFSLLILITVPYFVEYKLNNIIFFLIILFGL